jgi:molybdate transport system substrate-binding protein
MMFILSLVLTGCGQKNEDLNTSGDAKDQVTIFAASSLTDAVNTIRQSYESENDHIDIRINYAGSKTLRSQLENGAQADIFLSANKKHYDALLDQGILSEGREILQNEMVLVLSKEGAEKIKTLEDLRKDHQLILAEKGVPAGDYGREVICRLGEVYGPDYEGAVLENLASSENNVRQVLMKIVLGEGDAAFVYKTDVNQDIKDQVVVLDIPKDYNVTASYWMGIVNNDMISESVRDCCAYIMADDSCDVFEKYGFCIVE